MHNINMYTLYTILLSILTNILFQHEWSIHVHGKKYVCEGEKIMVIFAIH